MSKFHQSLIFFTILLSGSIQAILVSTITGYNATWILRPAIGNPDGFPSMVIGVFDASTQVLAEDSKIPGNDTMIDYNHQPFPGPTVRVKVGQRVNITVKNEFYDIETSIHWHGIKQHGSQWMDGVPLISQCGIRPSSTFVYNFIANQSPGTYWYHSHTATQYSSGLLGAFIIESNSLEEDLIWQEWKYVDDHILILMDWMHIDYHQQEEKYLARVGSAPGFRNDYGQWPVQSILINGIGQFDCGIKKYDSSSGRSKLQWVTQEDCNIINKRGWRYWQYGDEFSQESIPGQCQPLIPPYQGSCQKSPPAKEFKCYPGKTVRIRIINSASTLPMGMWIDRHKITIVALDGMDVEPMGPLNALLIQNGQRFDLIVNCSANPNFDYYIYAGYNQAFYPLSAKRLPNWKTGAVHSYAILRYVGVEKDITLKSPLITPFEMLDYRKHLADLGSQDEFLPLFYTNLKPKNPLNALASPAVERIMVHMKGYGNYNGGNGLQYEWWLMNDKKFSLPRENPILFTNWLNFMQNENLKMNWTHPDLYGSKSAVPYIINLEYNKDNPIWYEIILVNYEPQPHPMHFHGFRVYLIGNGFFDQEQKWRSSCNPDPPLDNNGNYVYEPKKFGFPRLNEVATNCTRGDSFTIPPNGFSVFRLEANNPGAWYLHCHMDPHLMGGMATIISVAERDTGKYDLPEPPANMPLCGNMASYGTMSSRLRSSSL